MNEYTEPSGKTYLKDALRLEGVIVCVGFDDLLEMTINENNAHFDTLIVVTNHHDKRTQSIARNNGCIVVETDLFTKNGRNFNKGAAINAGFGRFQYHGWRMHMDADIVLPDNFRRLLFNHTTLDRNCIYGADRVDVVGRRALQDLLLKGPQSHSSAFINCRHDHRLSARYADPLRGYVPIGYFQLWHASAQKSYPYSLGTAQHDDVMFAEQWSCQHRRLLPTAICYHVCARPPRLGENWDGKRSQPRLK